MPKISYTITDYREAPSGDPNRRGKMDVHIAWLEDGARPYVLTMPAEEYTPDKAKAAVEAQVQRHALIIGLAGSVGS